MKRVNEDKALPILNQLLVEKDCAPKNVAYKALAMEKSELLYPSMAAFRGIACVLVAWFTYVLKQFRGQTVCAPQVYTLVQNATRDESFIRDVTALFKTALPPELHEETILVRLAKHVSGHFIRTFHYQLIGDYSRGTTVPITSAQLSASNRQVLSMRYNKNSQ